MSDDIRVTPAPLHKPSRMPMEHRLFLRTLQGLKEGEAIRLLSDGHEDAVLMARTIRSFIHRMFASGRLLNDFAVLRRRENTSSVVYVVKRQGK